MIHGGDIYRNQVKLDYSVNINPLGIPFGVTLAMHRAVHHCTQYPDIQAMELREAIGRRYGMKKEHILCGNGASELFQSIFRAVSPKVTGIPVPSFFGYEYAARAAGSKLDYLPMTKEEGFCLDSDILQKAAGDINLLILANPNNPVGNVVGKEPLKQLIATCKVHEIIVVVDECFIEFTGKENECSVLDLIGNYENLIVVRAFTKSFAIPGVRLGTLFCGNEELLSAIGRQLPEWNVSLIAQAAGLAAMKTTRYLERTVCLMKRERAFLTLALQKAQITVFPSETDFLLLYTKLPLYEELLYRQILIRDCSNFIGLGAGYYRIAVKKHGDNLKLIREIQSITSKK